MIDCGAIFKSIVNHGQQSNGLTMINYVVIVLPVAWYKIYTGICFSVFALLW